MAGVEIGYAHAVFIGDHRDDGGLAEHAIFVLRLQNFDEFVGDATEAARKNDALTVVAIRQAL